jgi:integrase/recombinase XerD
MKQGTAPFIPVEQLPYVLAACDGPHLLRDQALVLTSHFLGLRAKELAGLKVQDVFQNGVLVDTVRLLRSITKGSKYREAYLVNKDTRLALLTYLQSRPDLLPDDPLFLSQKGGHFSANSMQRLLAIIYSKAGIKASSHSGRRSFATRLIQGGADIYSVMELMGHTHIGTTQIYFFTSPERLKSVASILG